jgi:Protein of unknown function (DUF1461)
MKRYWLVFWPLFFLCHLLMTALLSWHLLAQFHFAYPLGYQVLNLDRHIAEYAPINNYKKEFEFVSKEEHWRLFSEISDAVQNQGRGLADIDYSLKDGTKTSLMHPAEIIHLQDVANLIDLFYSVGLIVGALSLVLIAVAYWKKALFPSIKKIFIGFMSGISLLVVFLLLIGPKKVFYWLHIKIFPEDHQWFFYYNDSLMTTLMKAPDIFAFIGVLLLVLLIAVWLLSLYGIQLLLASRSRL